MSKHIYSVCIRSHVLRQLFSDAVTREDYVMARWWNLVEVAALMFGNYDLAEATDSEEGYS